MLTWCWCWVWWWIFPSFFLYGTINFTSVVNNSIASNHVLLNMYTGCFFHARFTRDSNEYKLLLSRFLQMRSVHEIIMGSNIEIVFDFHFYRFIFRETAFFFENQKYSHFLVFAFFCNLFVTIFRFNIHDDATDFDSIKKNKCLL